MGAQLPEGQPERQAGPVDLREGQPERQEEPPHRQEERPEDRQGLHALSVVPEWRPRQEELQGRGPEQPRALHLVQE